MAARPDRSAQAQGQKRESFIQPLTAVIRNHGQLTPAELAVYLELQSYDWHGEGTWVGQKTIAHELGISERAVRNAVKKLEQLGAIEYQHRPGQSNLYKLRRAWVPSNASHTCRGGRAKTTPPTPAESAAHPGTICRTPRHNLPHTPAESAAEIDTRNYTQESEARTDRVPPPAASEETLSGSNPEVSQDPRQEDRAVPVDETPAAQLVGSSARSVSSVRSGMEALAKSIDNIDYSSPRPDASEEARVAELATRFDQIRRLIGDENATAMRWQKHLIGFRMMLFSAKHGRSYDDACLVLDYLKNNPARAREIVNKDKKRGVTNTYHLMFLFDRLLNEAVGRESDVEKMFSKRRVRIPDASASLLPDAVNEVLDAS